MKYVHITRDKQNLNYPVGKVVCVGRNYLKHIRELNSDEPKEPVLFIKPTTAIIDRSGGIVLPDSLGDCHYEVEISVLITSELSKASVEEVRKEKFYFGVGLDLTLRDLQQSLVENGLPWEKSKAFDNSCVLSEWTDQLTLDEAQKASVSLSINDEIKQKANASEMINPIDKLISHISKYFTLLPGDMVLTGTPSGVGKLSSGDKLIMSLNEFNCPLGVR